MANCDYCFLSYSSKSNYVQFIDELSKNPYIRWKRGENELELGVKQLVEQTRDIKLTPRTEKLTQYSSVAIEDPIRVIQNSYKDFEDTVKTSIGVSYTQPFEIENVLKNTLPER